MMRANDAEMDADEDAFWAQVDYAAGPAECWEWRGEQRYGGPGRVGYHGGLWPVRKLAWVLVNGADSEHSRVVMTCGTRLCVNPEHMLLRPKASTFVGKWG